jgi:hypothetical protein
MINSNNNLGGLNSISATSISATTFYGDGSNLTNLPGGGSVFTGGTVTGPTNFTSTLSAQTIALNTTYTGTTPVGTISWNTDFGVPQVGMIGGNVIGKINESVYAYVKNVDSSTLNKGEVVYIFGASGDKMSVKRASATGDTTSSKTLGVVAESIDVNGLGYIITQGTLDGLNLGAYTAGDILWLGETPGTFTNIKKYAPNHLVFVGVVQRANVGDGQLYVKPQNGYELDELHNVKATGATNGDIIVYNSGTTLWENSKSLIGNYTVNGALSATTLQTPSFSANSNGMSASSINGVYISPYVRIGSAYTATTANSTIEITGVTSFTVALYTAVGNPGRTIYIKNSGSGIVTVDAHISETIDGQLTRTLGQFEDLFLQSNGNNWIILNREPVLLQFGHEAIDAADATNYFIGNFITQPPSTTASASRRVIALSSGWITNITAMISVPSVVSVTSDNSILTLQNVTSSVSATITSTLKHNIVSQLLLYTLATPLRVTKGDILQIAWTTPTWSGNPQAVRQIFTALIE